MFSVEKILGPLLAERRAISDAQQRLLDVLVGFDAPVTLAELAEAAGLHENTVRGHLDALHERGHVTRLRVAPHGPGRPAWSWLARRPAYAALAEALARAVEDGAGVPAREAGRRAGRAWGERLAEQLGTDDDTAQQRLNLALEHVGFAPEEQADGTVRLTRCPFLEAARVHQDSVCSVHRGLIEGALGGAVDPTALRPFAEPGACRVTLA